MGRAPLYDNVAVRHDQWFPESLQQVCARPVGAIDGRDEWDRATLHQETLYHEAMASDALWVDGHRVEVGGPDAPPAVDLRSAEQGADLNWSKAAGDVLN